MGAIFIAVALVLAGGLVWLEVEAAHITVTALVLFALLGGLFYLGLRLLRPKDLFEIDVERRTYSVIRDGKPSGSGPLDDLGPLEMEKRVYRPGYDRGEDPDAPAFTVLIEREVEGRFERRDLYPVSVAAIKAAARTSRKTTSSPARRTWRPSRNA